MRKWETAFCLEFKYWNLEFLPDKGGKKRTDLKGFSSVVVDFIVLLLGNLNSSYILDTAQIIVLS